MIAVAMCTDSTSDKVSAGERARLVGQRPLTVWLTGLSGAGKSTLAATLERSLIDARMPCFALDGDDLRAGICRDLGFSPRDRQENIRRVAEVARLMNDAGLIVIAAFISPYRTIRQMARDVVGPDRFVEVYADAPLQVCEKRDPKGLYRRARSGELRDLTGIGAPYEPPENPDIVLHSGSASVAECTEQLFALVRRRGSFSE